MKRIYLTLLIAAFTIGLSGQELNTHTSPTSGENADFKLYPNPVFNNVVYIATKRNDSKDIVVYDLFGEVVLRDRIATKALNISKLVPGVYMLQVTENSKTITRKLVVK
ncbi:MAG: T9SS type A sorting domain-containing protein [Saonia sp.]